MKGLFINENQGELFKKMGNSIRTDLLSSNEVHQSLAIVLTGSLAPKELVDVVFKDILNIALGSSNRSTLLVRKKAILCLLKIIRRHKEKCPHDDKWCGPLVSMLDERNLGFLSSAVSLINGLVGLTSYTAYDAVVPKYIAILKRLLTSSECPMDYIYYKTPNPWLLVKLLRGLQLFPPPTDNTFCAVINQVLHKIITKTSVTKSVNENNTKYGVLFEALNLIVHYRGTIDMETRTQTGSLLGSFISVKEPNIRYRILYLYQFI